MRAERAEQGLSTPADPRHGRGRGVKRDPYNLPPEPVPASVEYVSVEGDRSREDCIEALREYDRGLASTQRGSRAHYLDVREPNWPAPSALDRWDGFKAMFEEAQRLNLEERAQRLEGARAKPGRR